jgi:hypothetical protein
MFGVNFLRVLFTLHPIVVPLKTASIGQEINPTTAELARVRGNPDIFNCFARAFLPVFG